MIAGPESVTDATGVIIFESFSYAVPAGESETAVVKCNLANVAPGTNDDFAWEIANPSSADVSAEDDEGDGRDENEHHFVEFAQSEPNHGQWDERGDWDAATRDRRWRRTADNCQTPASWPRGPC